MSEWMWISEQLEQARTERDEAIRQSQGYLKAARDCLDQTEALRNALTDARLGIAVLGDTCKHLGLDLGQQSAIRMIERIDIALIAPPAPAKRIDDGTSGARSKP